MAPHEEQVVIGLLPAFMTRPWGRGRSRPDVFVGDQDELAEVRWVTLPEAEELLPGLFEPVHRYLLEQLGRPA
jgi:hypothetical protein